MKFQVPYKIRITMAAKIRAHLPFGEAEFGALLAKLLHYSRAHFPR